MKNKPEDEGELDYRDLLSQLGDLRSTMRDRLQLPGNRWYQEENGFWRGTVVDVPDGGAPLFFRQQWVGVELKTLVKAPEGLSAAGVVFRQPLKKSNQEYYGVFTPDALQALLARKTDPAMKAVEYFLDIELPDLFIFGGDDLMVRGIFRSKLDR